MQNNFKNKNQQIGILITNLGTPDSPTKKDLKKYLNQFLMDKRVVDLSRLFWVPLLKLIILNVRPKKSAKFSFLLSMPIIFGAGLLGIIDMQNGNLFTLPTILAAFLSSFLVGVLALKILLKLLEQGKFYFFGIYCIFIGIISSII